MTDTRNKEGTARLIAELRMSHKAAHMDDGADDNEGLIYKEAADEIERLLNLLSDATKERDEYREALGRIVMARCLVGSSPDEVADDVIELGAYVEQLAAPARELLFLYDWRPELAKMEEQVRQENDAVDPKEVKRLLREYGERKKAGWIALRAALAGDKNDTTTQGAPCKLAQSDEEGSEALAAAAQNPVEQASGLALSAARQKDALENENGIARPNSDFSDFIRSAEGDERREVFERVIDKSIARQNAVHEIGTAAARVAAFATEYRKARRDYTCFNGPVRELCGLGYKPPELHIEDIEDVLRERETWKELATNAEAKLRAVPVQGNAPK